MPARLQINGKDDCSIGQARRKYISLASKSEGKLLSIPNHCLFNSSSELFLTDPPYG